MTNNYRITPAANWDGPQGTGHHYAEAGRGDHAALSAQRWAARRSWTAPGQLPLEAQPNVVLDVSRASAFGEAIANTQRMNTGEQMLKGAVLGGALGLVLAKRREVKNFRQSRRPQ